MNIKNFYAINWLLRLIILASIAYFLINNKLNVGVFLLIFLIIIIFTVKLSQKIELILLILLLIHIAGILWLYTTNWFDLIFHFVWGFFLAQIILIYLKSDKKTRLSMLLTTFFAVSLATLFGVLWEFFEFFWDSSFAVNSIYPRAQVSLADTMVDLILDVLGAIIASCFYFFKHQS